MIRRLFISYAHKNGEWVWDTLVPVLRAAGEGSGLEVLIDHERFKLGGVVQGQADALQDQADATVAVLSPAYVKSDYCMAELERGVVKNPDFHTDADHVVVPIRIAGGDTVIPDILKPADPAIWCDLRKDGEEQPWQKLLDRFDVGDGLGVSPAKWLKVAREVVQVFGEESKSVNLVVRSLDANWRGMFKWVFQNQVKDFGEIDLNDPRTGNRPGLFRQILSQTDGDSGQLPEPPDDLVVFGEHLDRMNNRKLAIRHFDNVQMREQRYEIDVLAALRFATEKRKLHLLAQSTLPASKLTPREHKISEIDFHVVEL